jgi:signal transduction histidine kinase
MKTKEREIIDVNLGEIVYATLQMLELELNKKAITVEKNIEIKLPFIKADINEITRMVTNLLSNAIKYNKEKGKIFIDISSSQNYVVLKIKDTGIGLKPEEKQKLFLEFYRAKNDMTRGISGTGLGLSIVKRIVDSYYGLIEVESEYLVGTTFLIKLPINPN